MGRLKKKKSNDAAWTQKDEAVPNVVAETHPVTVRIKNGLPYIAITFVILAAGVASASLFGLIQHVPADVIIVFLTMAAFFVELTRLYLDHFKGR